MLTKSRQRGIIIDSEYFLAKGEGIWQEIVRTIVRVAGKIAPPVKRRVW